MRIRLMVQTAIILVLLFPFVTPNSAWPASGEKQAKQSYREARRYYHKLREGRINTTRRNWNKAIGLFREIIRRYPRSRAADDAQYSIGVCYQWMGDLSNAISAFSKVTEKYPKSNLADDAQYQIGRCYELMGHRKKATYAFRKVIENYFEGDMSGRAASKLLYHYRKEGDVKKLREVHAKLVKSKASPLIISQYNLAIRKLEAERSKRVLPQRRKSVRGQAAYVQQIRFSSSKPRTRIVVDLDREVGYEVHTLKKPQRIYIDLKNTILHPPKHKPIPVKDGTVKEIKASQFSASPKVARVVVYIEEMEDYIAFPLGNPDRIVLDVIRSGGSAEMAYKAPSPGDDISLAQQLGAKIQTIVIDPGHGGRDPGVIKFGLKEKHIVLDIAKHLKRILDKSPAYDVYLTREKDVFIPLEDRTSFANEKEADLFLSIHVNSSRSSRLNGVETYYLSARVSDEETAALAAFENATARLRMHGGEMSKMVEKIVRGSKIKESRNLAGVLQSGLVSRTKRSNRGVKRAPFVVLVGANMPAVLVEVSFLSNAQEAKLLRTKWYRQRIAEGLAKAVDQYASRFNVVMDR